MATRRAKMGFARSRSTRRHPERDLQKLIHQWLDAQGIKHHTTPNEQMLGPKVLGALKAMGLRPGFPDLTIDDSPTRRTHPGYDAAGGRLHIEVKRPGEEPTDEQRKVHAQLRADEQIVIVTDDFDHCIKALVALGYGR